MATHWKDCWRCGGSFPAEALRNDLCSECSPRKLNLVVNIKSNWVDRILQIPVTQPARKAMEIRLANTFGELSEHDVEVLRSDWEYTCVVYRDLNGIHVYHTKFPLD